MNAKFAQHGFELAPLDPEILRHQFRSRLDLAFQKETGYVNFLFAAQVTILVLPASERPARYADHHRLRVEIKKVKLRPIARGEHAGLLEGHRPSNPVVSDGFEFLENRLVSHGRLSRPHRHQVKQG